MSEHTSMVYSLYFDRANAIQAGMDICQQHAWLGCASDMPGATELCPNALRGKR